MAFYRGSYQHRGDTLGVLRAKPRQSRHRRAPGQLQSGADLALHGDFSPRSGSDQRARDHRRPAYGGRNDLSGHREVGVAKSLFRFAGVI